jgi:ribonucleases P/MRP protein subunit RPP40
MIGHCMAINNKFSVAVAYIGYAKALNTVSPPKLCNKLKAYGTFGNQVSWIDDLLCGRSQLTRVGSALSDVKTLISGMIQGSCLGPLLFVLYVNEVTNITT